MKSAGIGVVGVDAAHLGGREDHQVGLLGLQEGAHRRLVGQVERLAVARDDRQCPRSSQLAQDGAAHHAPVTCDEDAHPP